jgi:hypothetical protein
MPSNGSRGTRQSVRLLAWHKPVTRFTDLNLGLFAAHTALHSSGSSIINANFKYNGLLFC